MGGLVFCLLVFLIVGVVVCLCVDGLRDCWLIGLRVGGVGGLRGWGFVGLVGWWVGVGVGWVCVWWCL